VTGFNTVFPARPVMIGMIHLPPLPGFDGCPGVDGLIEHALRDLETLEDCGFDGVLIENEHDKPHTVTASSDVRDAMTRVTEAVVSARRKTQVGCEVLLNDPRASIDIANAANAEFIRTDYFVDRMTREAYGEFQVDPDGLLAFRRSVGADNVLILADIQVKYATMIEPRPLAESAAEASTKGADAIVVTGDRSGDSPSLSQLREAAGDLPVLIGSGLTADNATGLLPGCDGAIVGTALMQNGIVDRDSAARVMDAARG
jgi:membrane complex biogenesis BtpA family protein